MRAALLLLAFLAAPAAADEVYQAPEAFVAEALGGAAPEASTLWLSDPLRQEARKVLGHEPGYARVRYWRSGERTAWVLEEIGKERPITVGLACAGAKLEQVRVLVYRESRGWEVRFPAFLRQFAGATLTDGLQLDRRIDNISGATLSVNALTRLARVALLYHRAVTS
jgi:hypothetical protein